MSTLLTDSSTNTIAINVQGHILVKGIETWIEQLSQGLLYMEDPETGALYLVEKIRK